MKQIIESRRADSWGHKNSTILSSVAASRRAGVKPTINAPRFVWRWFMKAHKLILPILHITDNSNRPPVSNNALSLFILWNKAISAQDRKSPVYDENWTFDMLPDITRYIVRIPNFLFPRLFHATVEVRTAYLNKIIGEEIKRNANKRIRLVSIGAGYDVRCTRLLSLQDPNNTERMLVDEAWELDVDKVLLPKRAMLERLQTRRRKDDNSTIRLPVLREVDLNKSTRVDEVLAEIFGENNGETNQWHTILISEAVFIYLDKGVSARILRQFSERIAKFQHNNASFCFADLLENCPEGALEPARLELNKSGWKLIDWFPRPARARHMGLACLASATATDTILAETGILDADLV